MARWDGIGDLEDWGDYYAGKRTTPPTSNVLDANGEATAWEWAAVTLKVDRDRAQRFAQYMQQNRLGEMRP